jgi:hypothetical protein
LVVIINDDQRDLLSERRTLGQKTLAMAIHCPDTADTSRQMLDVVERLDPLESKRGTKVSNTPKKVSNRKPSM